MRSGVIIAWFPKSNKDKTFVPLAKYFERYQDARDESAKMRADNIRHELWSKHGGLERTVNGNKSCVNWEASKYIPSESQKHTWAKKVEADAAKAQAKAIAEATAPKTEEPPKPPVDDPHLAKELKTEEIDETTE